MKYFSRISTACKKVLKKKERGGQASCVSETSAAAVSAASDLF